MPPRLPPLLDPPIGFAHRGARAHTRENTLEAFELALRLGATGLESDVWVTADGVAVLDHDGVVGSWPRRRPMASVTAADRPDHIPTLADFYDLVGDEIPVSLDVKDDAAFAATVATARQFGAEEQLWLCHHELEVLRGWRHETTARLVDSTRLHRIKEGPERRAARLQELGIDAVNLRQTDWTGGLVTLFHRFERVAFGWDAQQPREIAELVDIGIDGVFSDHVDRLHAVFSQFFD